jgi:hypothetical protein
MADMTPSVYWSKLGLTGAILSVPAMVIAAIVGGGNGAAAMFFLFAALCGVCWIIAAVYSVWDR